MKRGPFEGNHDRDRRGGGGGDMAHRCIGTSLASLSRSARKLLLRIEKGRRLS